MLDDKDEFVTAREDLLRQIFKLRFLIGRIGDTANGHFTNILKETEACYKQHYGELPGYVRR